MRRSRLNEILTSSNWMRELLTDLQEFCAGKCANSQNMFTSYLKEKENAQKTLTETRTNLLQTTIQLYYHAH
jgi:hypothetical protein